MSGPDYDTWTKTMNDKAKSYGFRDLADMTNTFYTPEQRREHPLSTDSHYAQMFETMDKIRNAYAKEQSASNEWNWRDKLTGGLIDGRTRKEICRDNLNRYLDVVQSNFHMNDDQMKKLCRNLGVPVNGNGRVALNSDIDRNPITTDVNLATAFNNPLTPSGVPQTDAEATAKIAAVTPRVT